MFFLLVFIIFIIDLILYRINEDMYKDRRINNKEYNDRHTFTYFIYIVCISYFICTILSEILKKILK